MPITRKFLDWTRPALVTAAEYLVAAHTVGGTVDLGGVVVVTPGRQAGRRMLEILVQMGEQRGLALIPPGFMTSGGLPELLYRPKLRFATDLEQQLAWAQALQGYDQAGLAEIMRQPPADDGARGWLELGDVLRHLHRKLATDVLNFADVIRLAREMEGFFEERRWQILSEIQERYLRLLDSLQLWDVQTARRVAIERKECQTHKEIVLVGTVDLNAAVRKMLDLVSDRVTALIFAPLELTDRFDSHGCVIAQAWKDSPLDIPEDQILSADDAADQAETVARTIAAYGGRYRADEITIGVPDESLVPQVERLLAQFDLPSRWGPGQSLARGGVYRLLEAVSRYVAGGGFAEFAALVRHPDITHWLLAQGIRDDWLIQLDRYYNAHFPARMGEEWLGDESEVSTLLPVHNALQALLKPLIGKTLPLHEWSKPLVDLLAALYGNRVLDRDDATGRNLLVACQKLFETLQALAVLSAGLAPVVSAAEAIELALEQVAGETIPSPTDADAIELLGWLELPLDDAPALVVTSFNEGFVPAAVNCDSFLPNALCTRLGLEDNDRRYARDAYALSVLLASRRDLSLIVARRDTEKNPLTPSRLLFAADGPTIARRALAFFEPRPATVREPLVGSFAAVRERSALVVPQPRPLEKPVDRLSATAFRYYLACPYRFYLRNMLRLEALHDAADELDGGAFGTLMHLVLQRFAESDARDSTDPEAIRRVLQHELNECVAQTYGWRPAAAIAIQAEQLRTRLDAFATRQAERAAQGWRIEFAEPPDTHWPLEVDGQPFVLTGRIDRIDVHEATGKRAIFDYKSSDAGLVPRKTHQRRDEWVDLQLPLYRYLAQSLKLAGPFELGYILLPKDVAKCGFALADWDESELASADATAFNVIRALRNEKFWPRTDPPPPFSEDFAGICQDGVFDREAPV